MHAVRPLRAVLALGLTAAAPLAAQGTFAETRKPVPAVRKAAFACPAGQIVFQKTDGNFTCIAADANPCPPGRILDKTTKPGVAVCGPLPTKTPYSCPAPQVVFQKADGQLTCIAPDAKPCPQGQVLEKTASSGHLACKPLPARTPPACPAGQVAFQKPNGQIVCVAGP